MRAGKEEGKITVPLFPRLHVNDATDNGGPRPPPRNKMALYEQLSVPSKRFKHASVPSLPISSHSAGAKLSKLPSTSANPGQELERSLCSSYHSKSDGPTNANDKVLSNDGRPLNSIGVELERISAKEATCWPQNDPGHLQLAAEPNVTHSRHLSNLKASCTNVEDEDDYSVPTFVHYGNEENMNEKVDFQAGSSQKNAAVTVNSSNQLANAHEYSLEICGSLSKSNGSHKTEIKGKASFTPKISTKKMIRHQGAEGKASLNTKFVQESTSLAVNVRRSQNGTTCLYQNDNDSGSFREPKYLINSGGAEIQDASKMSTGSASKRSPYKNSRYPIIVGASEGALNVTRSMEPGNITSDDEASETSILDSISGGFVLSPDDLVSLLGLKHFWKSRRAIINQQRVFAVQVFELHRLIKVQKLIAASPHILLEGNPYLSTIPRVTSKNINSEYTANHLLQNTGQKDDCQKDINKIVSEPPMTATNFAIPLPFSETDSNKRPSCHVQQDECCSGNPSSVPVAFENRSSPWHVHPSSNQWLIPVISPTEGLIYKPVAGPCPATATVMAPMGCSLVRIPPPLADFMNPSYVISESQQQQNTSDLPRSPVVATRYFPASYGTPFVSPAAAEIRAQPSRKTEQPSHNSGNVSSQRCGVALINTSRVATSRDSDLRGRAESNSSKEVQGRRGSLNLLPTASVSENLDSRSQAQCMDHRTHLVKVVPHDSSFATESAAHIFQFIQKERQRYDYI